MVSTQVYAITLLVCVVLLVADTVLVAVLLEVYTDTYAQYINQATGLVYGIISLPIVWYRLKQRQKADQHAQYNLVSPSDTKPPPPRWMLVLVGASTNVLLKILFKPP